MSIQQEKFKAIANKIREKTGITEKIKPNDFADKIDDVYKQGKTDEYNKMWDRFQRQDYDDSSLTSSQRRFHGYWWGWDNFYPKYDIKIKGTGEHCFYCFASGELQQSLKNRLDECGVKLDTSAMTNCGSMFGYSYISEIPELDFTSVTTGNAVFANTWARLEKIELIIVTKTLAYTSWFSNATGLIYIRFKGEIGKSIDFKSSPLDLESAKSVITHLFNYKGTDEEGVYSVTFSETTWNYLDADVGIEVDGVTYSWREYISYLGWTN